MFCFVCIFQCLPLHTHSNLFNLIFTYIKGFFLIFFSFYFGCIESSLRHTGSRAHGLSNYSVTVLLPRSTFPYQRLNPSPGIRKQIINHWTTRDVLLLIFKWDLTTYIHNYLFFLT